MSTVEMQRISCGKDVYVHAVTTVIVAFSTAVLETRVPLVELQRACRTGVPCLLVPPTMDEEYAAVSDCT